MKKVYNFNYLLAFIALFFVQNLILAQDTLDVAPFNDEGDFNLVPSIWGDTTDTGERKNLNRVYRLEREGVYVMNQTVYADFPIRLVANSDDDSKSPPILIRGSYATGDNIKTFFTFTADGLSHSFKNIIFNGVDLDGNYFNEWNRGLKVAGNSIKLTLDNCVMNAWAGVFLDISGSNPSLFLRDCKWRNGVSAQAPPWGAQQVVFNPTELVDTVVMTNNTTFNTRGFILDFEIGAVANYIQVEHNTFFTGAIDMLRMRDMSNAVFRSNIYYGTHAYGQAESERNSNWFDKDEEYLSLFSIDTTDVELLASIGLSEEEKDVLVSNNTYFFPQPLKDWWAANSHLNTPVWMNTRTKAMFDNDTAYPSLNAHDNVEMDPNFTDTDMETWIIEQLVKYCDDVRNENTLSTGNYDEHTGTTNLRFVPWPLPESLVYSNETMLTGGHDGLPIGDLNWYPEKRAEYDATGVNDILPNIAFELHPNPSSQYLNVNSQYLVNDISVYNNLGSLVKHINTNMKQTQLDISNLQEGVYIIKIQTEEGIGSKIFIKQ